MNQRKRNKKLFQDVEMLPLDKQKLIKEKSIRDLDKELWRWFSKFIRLRDSDSQGICFCISCRKPSIAWEYGNDGKIKFRNTVQAGHYYNQGSSYRVLKYDEMNVHGQCYHCNMHLEGNKQGYREGLIKKHGEESLKILDIRKTNKPLWNRFVYDTMIEEYKHKVKNILSKL